MAALCPADPFAVLEVGEVGKSPGLGGRLFENRFHDCCFLMMMMGSPSVDVVPGCGPGYAFGFFKI